MALDIVELAVAAMLEVRRIRDGLGDECAAEAVGPGLLLLDGDARGLGVGSGRSAGHLGRCKGSRGAGLLGENKIVNVHLIRVALSGGGVGLRRLAQLSDAAGARLSTLASDAVMESESAGWQVSGMRQRIVGWRKRKASGRI